MCQKKRIENCNVEKFGLEFGKVFAMRNVKRPRQGGIDLLGLCRETGLKVRNASPEKNHLPGTNDRCRLIPVQGPVHDPRPLSQLHARILGPSRRPGNSISPSDSEDELSAAIRSSTSSRFSADTLGLGRCALERPDGGAIKYFPGGTLSPLIFRAVGAAARAYAVERRGLVGSSTSISLIVLGDLPNPTRFLGDWDAGTGWELGVGRPFGRLFRFGADVGSAVLCTLGPVDAPFLKPLTDKGAFGK